MVISPQVHDLNGHRSERAQEAGDSGVDRFGVGHVGRVGCAGYGYQSTAVR